MQRRVEDACVGGTSRRRVYAGQVSAPSLERRALVRRWRYCLCICWWRADVGCHAAGGSSRHAVPPPRFYAVLCVRLFMCEAARVFYFTLLGLCARPRVRGRGQKTIAERYVHYNFVSCTYSSLVSLFPSALPRAGPPQCKNANKFPGDPSR